MTRRVPVAALLVGLLLSLTAWGDAAPSMPSVDGSLAVPRTATLALNASLTAKPKLLASSSEQRTPKSRARFGLAVLAGPTLLLVVVVAGLAWRWAWRSPGRQRRTSVALRAPPVLRLS